MIPPHPPPPTPPDRGVHWRFVFLYFSIYITIMTLSMSCCEVEVTCQHLMLASFTGTMSKLASAGHSFTTPTLVEHNTHHIDA